MDPLWYDPIVTLLARHLGVRTNDITPREDLETRWGVSTLDLVLFVLRLEEWLGVELPIARLSDVHTAADLANVVQVSVVRRLGGEQGALQARRASLCLGGERPIDVRGSEQLRIA